MSEQGADPLVDFRLRTTRGLKERVSAYAHAHTHKDAHGRDRPLSLNTAAVELLELALDCEALGCRPDPP